MNTVLENKADNKLSLVVDNTVPAAPVHPSSIQHLKEEKKGLLDNGCTTVPTAKKQQSGLKAHPLYRIWSGMIERCTNPNHKHFDRYGGRGISVCAAWRYDLDVFAAAIKKEIGPRPSLRHSLDRPNTDGDYEPGNTRWATDKEQARNRSNNRVLELGGLKFPLVEWAEKFDLPYNTLSERLRGGMKLGKALSLPLDYDHCGDEYLRQHHRKMTARFRDLKRVAGLEPKEASSPTEGPAEVPAEVPVAHPSSIQWRRDLDWLLAKWVKDVLTDDEWLYLRELRVNAFIEGETPPIFLSTRDYAILSDGGRELHPDIARLHEFSPEIANDLIGAIKRTYGSQHGTLVCVPTGYD